MWRSKNSSSSSSRSWASSPPTSGAVGYDWWKSSAGGKKGREVMAGETERGEAEELSYRLGPGTRRECVSPCRGQERCKGKQHSWVTICLQTFTPLQFSTRSHKPGEKKRWRLNMWKSGFPITNYVWSFLSSCIAHSLNFSRVAKMHQHWRLKMDSTVTFIG